MKEREIRDRLADFMNSLNRPADSTTEPFPEELLALAGGGDDDDDDSDEPEIAGSRAPGSGAPDQLPFPAPPAAPPSPISDVRLSRLTSELMRLTTDSEKANKRILVALDTVRHVYHSIDQLEQRLGHLEKRANTIEDVSRQVRHVEEQVNSHRMHEHAPRRHEPMIESQPDSKQMPQSPKPIAQPIVAPETSVADLDRAYPKGMIPDDWYVLARKRIVG